MHSTDDFLRQLSERLVSAHIEPEPAQGELYPSQPWGPPIRSAAAHPVEVTGEPVQRPRRTTAGSRQTVAVGQPLPVSTQAKPRTGLGSRFNPFKAKVKPASPTPDANPASAQRSLGMALQAVPWGFLFWMCAYVVGSAAALPQVAVAHIITFLVCGSFAYMLGRLALRSGQGKSAGAAVLASFLQSLGLMSGMPFSYLPALTAVAISFFLAARDRQLLIASGNDAMASELHATLKWLRIGFAIAVAALPSQALIFLIASQS